jgi:hypothetical protein
MYGSEASVDSPAIPDEVITWTTGEPTAGSAATIADGATVGDDNDAGQVIADLTAKLNAILAALRKFGIIAT